MRSYLEDAVNRALENGCVCDLQATVTAGEDDRPIVTLLHDEWCPLLRSIESDCQLVIEVER